MAHEHFYIKDNDIKDTHLLLNNPVLYYSGFVSDEPDWSISAHSHPFCEIIYICEGNGRFTIDNIEYSAEKGDLIVYNRGVVHEEYSNPDAPLKTYFCGLGNVSLTGQSPDNLLPAKKTPVIPTGVYSNKLENYISELVFESSYKMKGFGLICSNILSSILILIVRMLESGTDLDNIGEKNENQLSFFIIDYLKTNYNRNLTLAELSKHFYISKDYLSHVFKNETGMSPINYLLRLKIEEAKRLLVTTNKTVAEISAIIGYEDSNYMSQLFKKATGKSPTDFRKMAGEK